MIILNVTSAIDDFLSVAATISDTVSLNGVRMVCAELDITVMLPGKLPHFQYQHQKLLLV